MSTDLRQDYMERDILGADGKKLVLILYRAALEALAAARRHLARGEIAPRSHQITRASEMLTELALAVDHDTEGDLSRNLVELYDYIQFLIAKANAEQTEPPIVEAQSLLETLVEAWERCAELAPMDSVPTPGSTSVPADEYAPVDVTG